MASVISKPRARVRPNFAERSMGLLGKTPADVMAKAQDFFANPSARTGYGTPNLGEGAQYPLVRYTFNYWDLISLYEGNWIARRICDVPAQDMVRAWPRLTSDIDPKDLGRLDRAIRRTNTKGNMLTAMEWGRLFGGAGCLMVIKGQEKQLDEPLDLDSIEIGGFKGLIPFDRWSGIYPDTAYCTDINRPMDFNLPESYRVQATGGQSFTVHASRILRFTGPSVPTPEREAYQMWGISVLEPTIQEIQKRDNVSWNILNLTFRANILGMKFPELAQLLSGLGSSQKATRDFTARMSELNHMISNQSLVPLPKDGSIESTQYSFSGLGEVYTQFCLDISGAAQIPVARLWGRTITGLGQTGDGDERIYEERIATDQDTYLRPQLEKLFPVLCVSELGEVPDDLDLSFPSIRVLDEKERTELAKNVVDTVVVALNSGLISPQCAAEELAQSGDDTGVFTNLTVERIAKLSDDTQAEGELGKGLFGGGEEGTEPTGLNPASSPAKALKEDDRVGKAAGAPSAAPGKPGGRGEAPKDELAIPSADDPKAQDDANLGVPRAYAALVDAYKRYEVRGPFEDFIRRVAPKRIDEVLEYARHRASAVRAKDFKHVVAKMTPELVWLEAMDNEALTIPKALRGTEEGQRLCRQHATKNIEFYAEQFGADIDKCKKYARTKAFDSDGAEAFEEQDHPRDDDGKFTSGSGGSSAHLKSYAKKEEWPEHIKALKLPPAWTDVRVSDDPNAAVQAVGKDSKGRAQYVYSKKFQNTQAALKFDRIAGLNRDMPLVESQLAKLRKSPNEKLRNHADCMTLVQKMGIRPGSDEDTKSKVKAYGASTLEGRHVKVDGDKVRLQFIGKKGVPIDLEVTDKALAANLKDRASKAGPDGRLFDSVTGSSLLEVAHSLDHGGYKTKDFRTYLGTSEAGKLVKSMSPPKDERQYKKQVLEIAKAISAKLGNTPTVALQSYIAPQVFAEWRAAYA